jgi:hypothetical protein
VNQEQIKHAGIAAAVGLAVVFVFQFVRGGSIDLKRSPSPDLRAAFASSDKAQARQDALTFAGVNGVFAACMNLKDEQGGPAYRSGKSLDNLRHAIREAATGGWSFVERYPALKPILEKHFTDAVGTDAGPLDDAQRAKWIEAAKQLRDSASFAAKNL